MLSFILLCLYLQTSISSGLYCYKFSGSEPSVVNMTDPNSTADNDIDFVGEEVPCTMCRSHRYFAHEAQVGESTRGTSKTLDWGTLQQVFGQRSSTEHSAGTCIAKKGRHPGCYFYLRIEVMLYHRLVSHLTAFFLSLFQLGPFAVMPTEEMYMTFFSRQNEWCLWMEFQFLSFFIGDVVGVHEICWCSTDYCNIEGGHVTAAANTTHNKSLI